MTKLTAQPCVQQSPIGQGITLHNENGDVMAMFGLRSHLDLSPEEVTSLILRITAAINAGQPEGNIRHLKKGQIYDVMAGAALFQVSNPQEGLFGIKKGRIVEDGDRVVTYRNAELGMTFVRFPDEIEDDTRFEQLEA